MKNKDKLSKPSSAGRVAGKGLSTKWGSYYTAGVRKEKKTSSESQSREVEALKAQVARILELVQEQVEQQLGTKLNAIKGLSIPSRPLAKVRSNKDSMIR